MCVVSKKETTKKIKKLKKIKKNRCLKERDN